MEWNEETIGRLRALWDEGLSTAEIGRRLGVSKNAVVGKAHRMTLAARPSPIRRDGAASPRATNPRRVVGSTLPPLPMGLDLSAEPLPVGVCLAVSIDIPAQVTLIEPAPDSPEPPQPASASPEVAPEPIAPPIRVVPPVTRRSSACCWPLGDPGTRSFRFCDAASLAGKPYCAEHAQVAYVKVRDRREEAA
jgi:GcrA cell cycle regulator